MPSNFFTDWLIEKIAGRGPAERMRRHNYQRELDFAKFSASDQDAYFRGQIWPLHTHAEKMPDASQQRSPPMMHFPSPRSAHASQVSDASNLAGGSMLSESDKNSKRSSTTSIQFVPDGDLNATFDTAATAQHRNSVQRSDSNSSCTSALYPVGKLGPMTGIDRYRRALNVSQEWLENNAREKIGDFVGIYPVAHHATLTGSKNLDFALARRVIRTEFADNIKIESKAPINLTVNPLHPFNSAPAMENCATAQEPHQEQHRRTKSDQSCNSTHSFQGYNIHSSASSEQSLSNEMISRKKNLSLVNKPHEQKQYYNQLIFGGDNERHPYTIETDGPIATAVLLGKEPHAEPGALTKFRSTGNVGAHGYRNIRQQRLQAARELKERAVRFEIGNLDNAIDDEEDDEEDDEIAELESSLPFALSKTKSATDDTTTTASEEEDLVFDSLETVKEVKKVNGNKAKSGREGTGLRRNYSFTVAARPGRKLVRRRSDRTTLLREPSQRLIRRATTQQ